MQVLCLCNVHRKQEVMRKEGDGGKKEVLRHRMCNDHFQNTFCITVHRHWYPNRLPWLLKLFPWSQSWWQNYDLHPLVDFARNRTSNIIQDNTWYVIFIREMSTQWVRGSSQQRERSSDLLEHIRFLRRTKPGSSSEELFYLLLWYQPLYKNRERASGH